MNLADVDELKNVLRLQGFKPKDYLGQNFLVDEDALNEIVLAADLQPSDVVLEVGPGLGVLTGELVKTAKQVIAVEKDPRLVSFLKKEFRDQKNLQILNDDILRFHLKKNLPAEYKLVANIPYYLTSKLFQIFLESDHRPQMMVLMVQKEVGERVTAGVGDLSILGISVQIYSDAEIVAHVPKESFWPTPKVDSVILQITPKEKYPEIKDKKLFFRVVKIAFAGKRKQIQNSLVNGLKISKDEAAKILAASGIESTLRPQDIGIAQWIALYQNIGRMIWTSSNFCAIIYIDKLSQQKQKSID